jgi:hypothetical protein
MRIADEITILIGREKITLRPSLRHAMRLERREGSFAGLMQAVAEESLSAACDIIGDHIEITPKRRKAIFANLITLKFALVEYVGRCTGIDPEDVPAEGNKGKTVPIEEYLTDLYRLGTGWLGWTPEETLDATPAQIKEAYAGRMDMLKSIFGSGDEKPKSDTPATPDQLAAKFKFIMGGRAAAAKKAKG